MSSASSLSSSSVRPEVDELTGGGTATPDAEAADGETRSMKWG